jgi:hypothetical protein
MPRRLSLTSTLVLPTLLLGAACEPVLDTDPLSHLPKYEEQRRILCERGRDNAVTDFFCRGDGPDLTSLVELEEGLGIGFATGRPSFSFQTNSTALSLRHTSSINPRAILLEEPDDRDDGAFLALGFTRGEQLVEMAVRPPDGELALYLVRYEQPCTDEKGGCTNADRFTPRTESGWTKWSIYDDVDLENSVFDCLVCHQPDGPGTPRMFRMQEFINPWTHWMAPFGEGELALFNDYKLAHAPDESYAGIPPDELLNSNPIRIENFVLNSGAEEPLQFPSQVIENEVKASSPGQPVENVPRGHSATWEELYERGLRGEVGPVPYHDVKTTDAGKLANAAAAYKAFMAGDTDELPDVTDVLLDDALPRMSIRPKPGLSGEEILVHMCAQCHNGRLDPSLSRARFNALALDDMSREEKDLAIDRLKRPSNDRYKMPPVVRGELSDDELERAIAALKR